MPIKKLIIILGALIFVCLIAAILFFAKPLYFALLLSTQDWQRCFHDEIGTYLRMIQQTDSFMATMFLSLIGFLYGILHAIGPGHGKIVVSSYLLASDNSFRKGLIITFSSAFLQALMAVMIVLGLTKIMGFSQGEAKNIALSLGHVSICFMLLVGVILCAKGIKELIEAYSKTKDFKTCRGKKEEKKISLVLLILSIGLRPCSGALLLLLFASLIGAIKAGVFAAFAMALGTAITTSTIALLALRSKKWMVRFSSPEGKSIQILHAGFSIAGGIMILLFSLAFSSITGASASLLNNTVMDTSHHPLMKHFSQQAK